MQLHVLAFANAVKINVDACMSDKEEAPAPVPSPHVTQAWINLMRAQQRVLAMIERDFKAAGLPGLGWYDVLWELSRADGGRLRPFEIEERTLLAQYNLSRLIDRMVAAGLVKKATCPEDKRGHLLTLTEAGRKQRKATWPVYAKAVNKHLAEKLSEAETEKLGVLLRKLTES